MIFTTGGYHSIMFQDIKIDVRDQEDKYSTNDLISQGFKEELCQVMHDSAGSAYLLTKNSVGKLEWFPIRYD